MSNETTSLYQKKRSVKDGSVPFPLRLGRVMFPRLQSDALVTNLEGGFLFVTEKQGQKPKENGMSFVFPQSFQKMIRHKGDKGAAKGVADAINTSFTNVFSTTGQVKLGLKDTDFVSSKDLDDTDLEETNEGDWNNVKEVIINTNKNPTMNNQGRQNVAAILDQNDKEDIKQLDLGISDNVMDSTYALLLKFRKLPSSQYSSFYEYGSNLPLALESGSDRSSTQYFENMLKQRSVYIVQSMANTFKDPDKKTVVDRTDFGQEAKKDMIPDLKINASENSTPIRFWQQYPSEIKMPLGLSGYKVVVLEWEPMLSDEGWPDTMPTPQYKESFIQSRLNDLRHYVLVIVTLDKRKIQQYYAWAPENEGKIKENIMRFNESYMTDPSLNAMSFAHVASLDTNDAYKDDEKKVDDKMLSPSIFTGDMPNYLASSADKEISSGVLNTMSRQNLPIKPSSDSTISMRMSDMQPMHLVFMKRMPGTKGDYTGTASDIWPMTYLNSEVTAEQKGFNAVGIDQKKTTLEQRFKNIATEYKQITSYETPLVHPVVNKALREIKDSISKHGLERLRDGSIPYETEKIEQNFEDIFRPQSNIYIMWVISNVLTNIMLPSVLDVPEDVCNALRIYAQKLLDTTAFSYTLGKSECLHVFHVDVINPLVLLARQNNLAVAEKRLHDALYYVTIQHPLIGVPLADKNKSFKNLRTKVKFLKNMRPEMVKFPAIAQYLNEDLIVAGTSPMTIAKTEANKAKDVTNKLIANFDYWTLVLLDKEYFLQHTYGIRGVPTAEKIKEKRLELVNILRPGSRQYENMKRDPLEMTKVVYETADKPRDLMPAGSGLKKVAFAGQPSVEDEAVEERRKQLGLGTDSTPAPAPPPPEEAPAGDPVVVQGQ